MKDKSETLYQAFDYDDISLLATLNINYENLYRKGMRGGEVISPIEYAVQRGAINSIKCLIEHHFIIINQLEYLPVPSPNYSDEFSKYQYAALRSLLHYAVKYKKLDIIKYLVEEKNANINICDNYQVTPFHLACACGDLEIVKLLYSKDAYIEAWDFYNDTPLYYGAKSNYVPIIKFLIEEAKVKIEVQNNNSYTPLHSAVNKIAIETVKYFAENNLNLNQESSDGNPIDLIFQHAGFSDERKTDFLKMFKLLIMGGDTPVSADAALADLDIQTMMQAQVYADQLLKRESLKNIQFTAAQHKIIETHPEKEAEFLTLQKEIIRINNNLKRSSKIEVKLFVDNLRKCLIEDTISEDLYSKVCSLPSIIKFGLDEIYKLYFTLYKINPEYSGVPMLPIEIIKHIAEYVSSTGSSYLKIIYANPNNNNDSESSNSKLIMFASGAQNLESYQEEIPIMGEIDLL